MDLRGSGIELVEHQSDIVEIIGGTIREHFTAPDNHYISMDLDAYRLMMVAAQDQLNQEDAVIKITASIYPALVKYLETDAFLVQSNLYLRASRPEKPWEQENIGWHRESFYGPNMSKAVNIWTPIQGVDERNTLKIIPGSQAIPDDSIHLRAQESESTAQFSAGHKLGFNYRHKIIEGGVDLTTAEPLLVDVGFSAIFPGNLIHGAAKNDSINIRFSVDYRVIRRSDYSATNKKFHFSSGKPYFIEYSHG